MSPAPSRKHQDLSGILFGEFYNYLKDKKFSVYTGEDKVKVGIFEDLEFEMVEIF